MRNVSVLSDNGFISEQLEIAGICHEKLVGAGTRLVVVGSKPLDKDGMQQIRKLCSSGMTAILASPGSEIAGSFGFKAAAGKAQISIPGGTLQVFGPCLKSGSAFESKRFGKGMAIALGFDFQKTLFRLTHGNDVLRDTDNDGVMRADDGVVVKDENILFPQADAAREVLCSLVEESLGRPVLRKWFFPECAQFALIASHDSDGLNDESLRALAGFDIKNNIRSTTFLRSHHTKFISKGLLESLDFQQHTTFFYLPGIPFAQRIANRIISARAFAVFQRLLLSLQRKAISKRFKAVGNRSHGYFWGRLDSQPSWLSHLGFEFDSTFGSNYRMGYMHGTGLPFFLRKDSNSASYNLLEFPVQVIDDAIVGIGLSQSQKMISGLLANSSQKFKSMVVLNQHFNLFSKTGEIYSKTIALARKKGAFVESMSFFNRFWRKRMAVRVLGPEAGRGQYLYSIDSKALFKGFTLALKAKGWEKPLVYGNGKKLATAKTKLFGKAYCLFSFDLRPGENRVRIVWEEAASNKKTRVH